MKREFIAFLNVLYRVNNLAFLRVLVAEARVGMLTMVHKSDMA